MFINDYQFDAEIELLELMVQCYHLVSTTG